MNLFKNLKIGTKIILGFSMVAIISMVIGVVGIVSLNTIQTKDTDLYEKITVPMTNISNMTESIQMIRVGYRLSLIHI
jgi:methyl-accepting chemotaxis protein